MDLIMNAIKKKKNLELIIMLKRHFYSSFEDGCDCLY